jgi:hypothetical protein
MKLIPYELIEPTDFACDSLEANIVRRQLVKMLLTVAIETEASTMQGYDQDDANAIATMIDLALCNLIDKFATVEEQGQILQEIVS